MFEKKRCGNCGERVKTEYNYCPSCGENLSGRKRRMDTAIFSPFGNMFQEIEKEFERIDKSFGTDYFKKPRLAFRFPGGGGISVTIMSGSGFKPKVDVKTYGQYKNLEPQIKKKLGVGALGSTLEEKEERTAYQIKKIPKITEEPDADIKDVGAKQIITIKLPGVRSEDDIEIKKLEQSVEVKAVAGDKAYFKLIPIKAKSINSKWFKDGILTIGLIK